MNEGYDAVLWGEDILAGLRNGSKVIDSFLNSPGHSEVLMNPSIEDVGVGVAVGNLKGASTDY
jgi:uncharacterized protein YkwD